MALQMLMISRERERAEGGKPFEMYVQNQYNERLLQHIGRSISLWQPRYKGWRQRLHLSNDGITKPASENMDVGRVNVGKVL